MNTWYKKSQNPTGSGAPFVIVLTFLIVFYILFLPPADRDALLNDNIIPGTDSSSTSSPSSSSQIEEDFTFVGPGLMSSQTRNSYEHLLGSFNLKGDYGAQVIERYGSFITSTTIFETKPQVKTFYIDDLSLVSNPILTFTVPQKTGILTIHLNGFEIFSGSISSYNVDPIELRPQYLQNNNELTFTVSSPGLAFWREHAYQIEDLRILADTIDATGLSSRQTFDLRSIEIQQLQSARLRFIADCDETNLGRLYITVNERELFSSIPDCGMINIIPIPRGFVNEGTNTLDFTTSFGSYLIDRVEVQTSLDEDAGVTYFFEFDDKYFVGGTNRSLKDEYEVSAEFQFVDDSKHKQAELIVNGFRTSIDTRQKEFTRNISEFVQPFNNYIQVIPTRDFSLVQVRVRLEER